MKPYTAPLGWGSIQVELATQEKTNLDLTQLITEIDELYKLGKSGNQDFYPTILEKYREEIRNHFPAASINEKSQEVFQVCIDPEYQITIPELKSQDVVF